MSVTVQNFTTAFSKATGLDQEVVAEMLNEVARKLEDAGNFKDVLAELTEVYEKMPAAKKGKGKGKKAKGESPKRAKSAWMFFSDAKRAETKAELIEETGEGKPAQVMTALGLKWKELSEEDKQPYVEQAKEAKEALTAEKEAKAEPETEEPEPPKAKGKSKPKAKAAEPEAEEEVKEAAKPKAKGKTKAPKAVEPETEEGEEMDEVKAAPKPKAKGKKGKAKSDE